MIMFAIFFLFASLFSSATQQQSFDTKALAHGINKIKQEKRSDKEKAIEAIQSAALELDKVKLEEIWALHDLIVIEMKEKEKKGYLPPGTHSEWTLFACIRKCSTRYACTRGCAEVCAKRFPKNKHIQSCAKRQFAQQHGFNLFDGKRSEYFQQRANLRSNVDVENLYAGRKVRTTNIT